MVSILAELFGAIGLDIAIPQTMSALIPYLINVMLGVAIIKYFLDLFFYWTTKVIGGKF